MDSWFAENITASDEYGFTTAAATSHVWFGILFARSISKSRIKLNEGIVSDGLACDKRKKFTATLWQGNYSDNFRELILELIWKTNIIKSSRSLRWIKKYKGSRLEITRRNEKLFVFLLRRDCKIKKKERKMMMTLCINGEGRNMKNLTYCSSLMKD